LASILAHFWLIINKWPCRCILFNLRRHYSLEILLILRD
jgi:hypothetical protein